MDQDFGIALGLAGDILCIQVDRHQLVVPTSKIAEFKEKLIKLMDECI